MSKQAKTEADIYYCFDKSDVAEFLRRRCNNRCASITDVGKAKVIFLQSQQ